jgi:hypothetical protein
MNLEKAIKVLKDISRACLNHVLNENISENSREFYEEDIEAIDTVLKELHTLQMNYKLLEEKFDGSAEEKVDKLTEELENQKQIKVEMRKVAYEEGYNQGYLAGAMERI